MVDYTQFKDEWLNEVNESGITNKDQVTHEYETTGMYHVKHDCMKNPIIIHPLLETYVTQNPFVLFMKIKYKRKT
jgi:hypothetical protein